MTITQNRLPFTGAVITGVGLISALGTDKETFFDFLRRKTPDTSLIEQHNGEPGKLIDALGITDPRLKITRYMDPTAKNSIIAMNRVMLDAGLDAEVISANPYEYAIVMGAVHGPYKTREQLYQAYERRGRRMVSGTLFAQCGYNMAAAMTAVAYSVKGPNLTFAIRSGLGIFLLRRANQLLRTHRAQAVFIGFSELKKEAVPSAPDLLQEAAYLLCLENKAHAQQRAAKNYIEFEEVRWDPPNGFASDQAGGVFALNGQLEQAATPGQIVERGKKLDLALNQTVTHEARYLPLLKLGLLVDDLQRNEQAGPVFMLTPTKNDLSMITLRRPEADAP